MLQHIFFISVCYMYKKNQFTLKNKVMRKSSIILVALVLVVISAFTINTGLKNADLSKAIVEEGIYKVDVKSSTVGWEGKKIAYGHNGTVDLAGGELIFEDGGLTGGAFEIDMTTIKNLDITEAKKSEKLVGHLKSKDFFDVENHPKVSFKINNVKKLSEGDLNYAISGDLTIKGITHPLSFGASVKEVNGEVKAKASFTFDRSKYNVKFQSGSFFENLGDKVIYDDVAMTVALVAKK